MGKATKGTVAFRIIYTLLTLIAVGIVIYALTLLWRFLEVYEKCQPENAIKAYVDTFSAENIPVGAIDVTFNEFEDESVLDVYIRELTDGEAVYRRNGRESDAAKTVYDININDKTVARATVTPCEEEAGFGMHEYEVSDIQFGKVRVSSCSVTIPSNASLYFGNKKVDEKYIASKGEPYPETEKFQGYFEGEICDVTYTVDGFIAPPEITVKDSYGNTLKKDGDKYVMSTTKNEELSQLALDFSKAYSEYILGDGTFYNVASYLAPDVPLYNELYFFENTWHNYHTDYDFLDIEMGDPLFYSDACAAVRIKYDHVLYGVQTDSGERHSAADYTVYLVSIDGTWQVIDLQLN